jgi:uncharacterized protein (TIGR03083 family)
MDNETGNGPFTADDLRELSRFVCERWTAGIDGDWRAPAGTLEWNCLYTADHLVDCVFSYAFFLASRKQDGYPNYGELHTLAGAGPADMIEGLRAVTTMLLAVIETAEPDATAVIRRHPNVVTGTPSEFAARGALEMILHAYDVCRGLGIAFDPPTGLCRRLLRATEDWAGAGPAGSGAGAAPSDPWAELLERSGRPRPQVGPGNSANIPV